MPNIARASSRTSRCSGCRKEIVESSLGIGVRKGCWPRFYTYWYHPCCYIKQKKVRKPPTTKDLRGYAKLSDTEKNEIRLLLWPNSVSELIKPRLKLSKNISAMKIKDLKYELQRRDLKYNGNKSELRNRLKEYLNSNECQETNQLLTIGYIRQYENKYTHIIIPMYLKMILFNYYPAYI
eukprot:96545_1